MGGSIFLFGVGSLCFGCVNWKPQGNPPFWGGPVKKTHSYMCRWPICVWPRGQSKKETSTYVRLSKELARHGGLRLVCEAQGCCKRICGIGAYSIRHLHHTCHNTTHATTQHYTHTHIGMQVDMSLLKRTPRMVAFLLASL